MKNNLNLKIFLKKGIASKIKTNELSSIQNQK